MMDWYLHVLSAELCFLTASFPAMPMQVQRNINHVVLNVCEGSVRDVVCVHVYIYVQVCPGGKMCVWVYDYDSGCRCKRGCGCGGCVVSRSAGRQRKFVTVQP